MFFLGYWTVSFEISFCCQSICLCWYLLTLTKLIWALTWTSKPPLFRLSQTLEHLGPQPFSANHNLGLCHFSLRCSVGSGRILISQHRSKMPSHRHKSYSVICLKLTVGFRARSPNTLLICLLNSWLQIRQTNTLGLEVSHNHLSHPWSLSYLFAV